MYCANCGTKQNESEKFCPNCGTRFEISSHTNIEKSILKEEKELTDTIITNKKIVQPTSISENIITNNLEEEINSNIVFVKKENNQNIEINLISETVNSNSEIISPNYSLEKINDNYSSIKTENKYAFVWEVIDKNGNNAPIVSKENYWDSGIISDVIIENNIDYEIVDTYKHFDERNGVFELLYILDNRLNETKNIIYRINQYNEKIKNTDYERIYLIIKNDQCIVNAYFKRKNLGFWDTLLSWDPEYEFVKICNLCEPLKI